jgi:hypothetical protein
MSCARQPADLRQLQHTYGDGMAVPGVPLVE